ncbi:hypothetical protein [Dialister invisus]|uniref:hypothetical protein n=1 Tax=Dialister invisus TaxID=218538 RepID=UPI0028D2C9E4|nr:hypothetical protein [Dialister invisus]
MEEPKAYGRGGYVMGNLTNEFIKKIIELNNEAALSMQADCLPFMWILYINRTFSRFGINNEGK